jgi:hypothetical protein
MTFTYTYAAHGYMFRAASDHYQHECTWCRQARETALEHMRDASLRTTKSTKYEVPTDIPHTVHVTRLYRATGASEPSAPRYGTMYTGPFGSTIGLGEPWKVHVSGDVASDMSGTYVKADPKRPVVLALTEAEASAVLELLVSEWEHQTEEADMAYQNGNGFEGECVQARTLAADAEKIADRLRKALAEHLDKAYAGELGS